MAPNPTRDTEPDDTAQAFDELRGEVSLTRRAVEGLTAARERVPDYSVTLGTMTKALDAAVAALARIEASPAVRLTPVALTAEIIKAAVAARADDAKLIHETRDTMLRATGRLDGIVERGQAADQQVRHRRWSVAGGAVAGMLLWSILAGTVARALPASWHVPEWMAAKTLGVDQKLLERRELRRASDTDSGRSAE